jgi:hypothetical protein
MKLLTFSTTAILTALAMTETDCAFEEVKLTKPLDWMAGKGLFPGRVIVGFTADLDGYDSQSWAEHVLEQCKTYEECTSALSFQGVFIPEFRISGREES